MTGERNSPKAAAAAMEPRKRAYVTLVAGTNGVEAVVQLAENLRKVGAAYPLVVAVLPDLPEPHRNNLVSHGCVVREIQPLYPAQSAMATTGFVLNCSMLLRTWEFVEYERIVYLDAGIHVLQNIDALFELEKGNFYAAELNAGMMMFVNEPSVATAQGLLESRRVTPPGSSKESFLKQDFLDMFFREKYKAIPLKYYNNLVRVMEHPQLDEAKRPWTQKLLPPLGSRLTIPKAVALSRQNLPAMATLAASSAVLGVVTSATNPAICFGFYAVFLAAIATVMLSLRGI